MNYEDIKQTRAYNGARLCSKDEWEIELVGAVLHRALDDYRFLLKNGCENCLYLGQQIRKKEVEKFLEDNVYMDYFPNIDLKKVVEEYAK